MSTGEDVGGGKRPGKTEWAGRRRPMTRRAGFSSHPDSTGGEFTLAAVGGYEMAAGDSVRLLFEIPSVAAGTTVGFGTWFFTTAGLTVNVEGCPARYRLKAFEAPNWSCV